jgi:5-aminopentanamidase
MDSAGLIRTRIEQCEAQGIEILCCPEGVLGGLADCSGSPLDFAITVEPGGPCPPLTSFASATVTTIVGFTELSGDGKLFNSAAVLHRGRIIGIYRKLFPAINRSVYAPGCATPVFQVASLTFGIVICNDSNYPDPARRMAESGATVIFVPTNNGLPAGCAHARIAAKAREVDIATAVANKAWVIRADVAGEIGGQVSYGSSGIVDPNGVVVASARPMSEDLIVADI